jgi:hypothetical protein
MSTPTSSPFARRRQTGTTTSGPFCSPSPSSSTASTSSSPTVRKPKLQSSQTTTTASKLTVGNKVNFRKSLPTFFPNNTPKQQQQPSVPFSFPSPAASSSASPITLAGLVKVKRGGVFSRSWKRKVFVLKQEFLSITKPVSSSPQNLFLLFSPRFPFFASRSFLSSLPFLC